MKIPPPSRTNAAMPLTLEALLDATDEDDVDDDATLDADDAGAELATEDATDDAGADDATTLAADDAGAELTTVGGVEPPPPPQAERASVNETIALVINNGFVLDAGFMTSFTLKIVRISTTMCKQSYGLARESYSKKMQRITYGVCGVVAP